MRTIIRDNYTPKAGDYHEKIVRDEVNNKQWIFDCDGVFTDITDTTSDIEVVNELGPSTTAVTSQKLVTDNVGILQQEIDQLKNSPDVVDIVDSYADLQAYDTSELSDKDVIRVLTDETHDNESSYYRWDKTNNQWVFIGAVEGYYTKAQTDTLLATKQGVLTAGTNISIASDNVISATDTTYSDFTGATSGTAGTAGLVPAPASGETDKYLKSDGSWATVSQYSLPAATASTLGGVKIGTNLSMDANDVLSATDTTYSNFVGTDGSTAGTAGLVPAPAATDAGKFLKADGTWDTAGGGGPTVVQTTGTSTTNVMSQNATTSMVYADPATKENVAIGSEQNVSAGYRSVVLGKSARLSNQASDAVCIGSLASASTGGTVVGGGASAGPGRTVAIGVGAYTHSNIAANPAEGAVAVGAFAYATKKGQFDISTMASSVGNTLGYNNSQYRLLTGLYDPQSDHDAATKGYVDGMITMTDTDPGEGVSLAAGKFIAVYNSNS